MFASIFGLFSRQSSIRSQSVKRCFCVKPAKFIRNREERHEAKLIQIKNLVIQQNIKTNGNIDWNGIVSQMVEQRLVNKLNFEKDLMSAFLLKDETNDQMDKKLFESLFKFLRALPNVVNNQITSSFYCHFISHFQPFIEESDIQLIRRTTDQMMAKHMDNKLMVEILNPCLLGLSKSSKDNCLHSFKLLNQMKKIDYKLVQQMINSGLDFNLIDQTLELIKKYPDIRLDNEIVSKLVLTLSENNPTVNQTLELLKILSNYLVILESDLKPNLIETFNKLCYQTESTSIATNCLCLQCNLKLREVTPKEQTTLLKHFNSIVFNEENDLLMKSFPEYRREFNNFYKFIDIMTKERPLNLVIDGLNIAFTTSPIVVEDKNNLRKYVKKYPIKSIDENIVDLLERNNVGNCDNVLIIGRKHMKDWKQLNKFLERHKNTVSMFYAMNRTEDDSYVLMASLQNPNTFLVSNDYYRDYSQKLDKITNLFDRWLKTHQIVVPKHEKQFVLPDLFEHRINISFDNKVIHIPFHSNDGTKIEWICCQNKNLFQN